MKNLKLKTLLFSLMASVMMTVFLSSCNKDAGTVDVVAESAEIIEEQIEYFTLPDEFNEMSDEELSKYFEDNEIEESDILKMATIVPEGEIQDRGCVHTTIYSYCKYNYSCSYNNYKLRLYKRRYCDSSGTYYYWTWGSCCY